MADQRFDDLARTLAGPISRRGMLKALLGATLGGALLHTTQGETFAEHDESKKTKCYKKGQFCKTTKQCCSHLKCATVKGKKRCK